MALHDLPDVLLDHIVALAASSVCVVKPAARGAPPASAPFRPVGVPRALVGHLIGATNVLRCSVPSFALRTVAEASPPHERGGDPRLLIDAAGWLHHPGAADARGLDRWPARTNRNVRIGRVHAQPADAAACLRAVSRDFAARVTPVPANAEVYLGTIVWTGTLFGWGRLAVGP